MNSHQDSHFVLLTSIGLAVLYQESDLGKGVQGAKPPAGARGVLALFSLLQVGRRSTRRIVSGSQYVALELAS